MIATLELKLAEIFDAEKDSEKSLQTSWFGNMAASIGESHSDRREARLQKIQLWPLAIFVYYNLKDESSVILRIWVIVYFIVISV